MAVVAAVSLTAGPALGAGLELSRGGQAKFPHRSFLLSLPPGTVAGADDVLVFENGDPVRALTVTSAGSALDGELGTVLVIDASNSMRGAPIEQAMSAARAFAEHRRPSQHLGIVTFNGTTQTLLEPTTDEDAIESALADPPPLARETHMRDGAMAGLDALQRAGIQVGSVIVLSDGADTGSRAGEAEVAAIASERGVRVFTVGLESEHFNPASLARLAQAGDGTYTAAPSASDLERIYNELGAQLAREYLVRYSSVVGPGKRVHVEATVEGVAGTATLSYRSPKLTAPTLPPANPTAGGLWGSAAAMVGVGFLVAFLICYGIALVLAQKRRPETPEERVAAFVAMGQPEQAPDGDEEQSNRLYDRVERGLRGQAWWSRFVLDVAVARIERKPAQIAVLTGAVTLLTMWLFAAISGAAWVALFAFLIPWGVRKFVTHRAAKQRLLFGEQLADNLQVIASAMRAGQSFGGALAVAVQDAPEPAKREFERVVADEQLGVPVEKSLEVVVKRMDNRDLHQVALVAALQREAGGNSAEVLDRVADTIRDRVSLRRLISTLTAQGRISRWVVSLVPVALVMFIGLTRPGYLDPLFKTTAGNILLGVAITMGVTGSLLIKKIVSIKV